MREALSWVAVFQAVYLEIKTVLESARHGKFISQNACKLCGSTFRWYKVIHDIEHDYEHHVVLTIRLNFEK